MFSVDANRRSLPADAATAGADVAKDDGGNKSAGTKPSSDAAGSEAFARPAGKEDPADHKAAKDVAGSLSASFSALVRDRLSAWESAAARRDRAEEEAAARLDDVLARLRGYSAELVDVRRDLVAKLDCVRDSLAGVGGAKAAEEGGDVGECVDGAGGSEERDGK